jgi:translation elongation factor EF-1alpha
MTRPSVGQRSGESTSFAGLLLILLKLVNMLRSEPNRFDEVCTKITPYLKQVGFNPKTDITFIPVSAYTGQNMKERVDKKIAPWSE